MSLSEPSINVAKASPIENNVIAEDRIYDVDMSGIVHDEVEISSYLGFIQKLTENGSREMTSPSVYSDANAYAVDWLASEFVEISDGRIEVEILGDYRNVLGRLPGYLGMGPAFMVGGHLDSVLGAPGANDDATGVATALELARVMSQYDWPLDIYFGCWNAEEVGLYGSAEAADILADRGVDILYYFNVDMLLVPDSEAPPDERVLMVYNGGVEYHLGKYWGDLARMMSNNVGFNMILPLSSESFGAWTRSDHMSFIGLTDGAVCFYHQSGIDGAYHTPADSWDNPIYDYVVATEAVATIGASMAFTMSRTYGESMELRYTGFTSDSVPSIYYFAISDETQFTVDGTWTEDIQATLYDDGGHIVATESLDGPTFTTEEMFDVNLVDNGLYTLEIENLGYTTMDHMIEVSYDSDVDGDDIPDSQQFWFDDSYFEGDSDLDGLSDGLEILIETDPEDPDTDSDLMPDGWEYQYGLDPLVNDANGDLDLDFLTNVEEFNHGTDPTNEDTDHDSMSDAKEVYYGLNPLVNDASEDADGDQISNLQEIILGTSPVSNDSDSDLMDDYWEWTNDLDPTSDDSTEDPDADGATNLEEYLRGTDPHVPDLQVMPIVLAGGGAATVLIIAGVYYKTKWVKM
jgi:hypothetical protein